MLLRGKQLFAPNEKFYGGDFTVLRKILATKIPKNFATLKGRRLCAPTWGIFFPGSLLTSPHFPGRLWPFLEECRWGETTL
jgi:hypothetical protein